MNKILNISTLIILALFSFKVFSLESTDILKTKILKIYNKNILILDRGVEDSVVKGDHIRLTAPNGFIARGICVKTSLRMSHWKIYRVVRPELVSKDTKYTLKSINQSGIPDDIVKYSKVDFSKKYNDIKEKDFDKQLKMQEDRIAKYDLPESVNLTKAFKQKKDKGLFDKIVEKTLDSKQAIIDISTTYGNIFASPMSFQTRYKQNEVHYGANIYNVGQKYRYKIQAIEYKKRIYDEASGQEYNVNSSKYDFELQINRVTEDLSFISEARYHQEKLGQIYFPYSHTQVGVLGLRYHFWEENPKSNFVDISYTPVFESFEYTKADLSGIDGRQGIRHKFLFRIYSDMSSTVHNKTILSYSPFSDLASFEPDYSDSDINISTEFSYKMSKQFFLDYKAEYLQEDFRNEVYGTRANNTIQTIKFRYEFSL